MLFTPEVRHFFAPGVYGREMFMPKDSLVIGKAHLRDHLCIVLGDVTVYSVDGWTHYEGYNVFRAKAGTQRTLVAHDATWWTTIHGNEDDEQDIEKLEARNVAPGLDTLGLDVKGMIT